MLTRRNTRANLWFHQCRLTDVYLGTPTPSETLEMDADNSEPGRDTLALCMAYGCSALQTLDVVWLANLLSSVLRVGIHLPKATEDSALSKLAQHFPHLQSQ